MGTNEETEFLRAETNAAAVIDALQRLVKPTTLQIEADEEGGPRIVALPNGLRLESLRRFEDERLERPRRIEGTAHLTTLESFCDHVNRFGDSESAVFASDDPRRPELLAVFDYHEGNVAGDEGDIEKPARPRFAAHRAHYAFPLSDPWKAWASKAGEWMEQGAFAEFLEAHIEDVIHPGTIGESAKAWAARFDMRLADPTTLMELSRGLAVRVDAKVAQRINLSTGEAQISYEETHTRKDESGPVMVPGGFVLGIPVFRGGELFQVPTRLRYRISNGKVLWAVSLHRSDLIFQTAFNDACEVARRETSLPLFFGRPES